MKNSGLSVEGFTAGVIRTFKEMYPDEMQNIDLPANLTEREQMKRILDYCVKKGYALPELLEKFPV